jgi:hypothetical protein
MKKNYADLDPLEELRAVKEEISRRFPTVKAYGDYLREKYPDFGLKSESPRKGRRTSTKAKANTKATARPVVRQRKSAAHTQ